MRPKGKLFALLAIFAAIGLVTATGAFTTVSATRTANVTVAGDADALLALEPHSGANGQAYAQLNNDQLEINLAGDFDSDGVSGGGVNPDALTEVDHVFNITNQGSQSVEIYITKTGNNNQFVQFYNGTVAGPSNGANITTSSNKNTLGPGFTAQISMEIDTRGSGLTGSDEILSSITIHANTSSTV